MKLDHGQPFKVVGNSSAASGEAGLRKLIRLVPNLLTLAAVVLGLTAIRLSGEGEFALAMTAILGAALLDAADGFAARKLSAEVPQSEPNSTSCRFPEFRRSSGDASL